MPRSTQFPVLLLAVVTVGLVVVFTQLVKHRRADHQLSVSSARYPMTISDNYGRPVTIARRPARVVSLAPSVTEILFAIGAGDRIVADTTYCQYPPEAATRPKVGGYLAPNVEKIAAFRPDLVVGDDLNGRELIDRLSGLAIPTVMVAPKTLEEVLATIELLGRAVGNGQEAFRLTTAMRRRRDTVLALTRDIPIARRPRTLFLFSLDQGLFSAGPGSYIDDFITAAGGTNIAAEAATPWPGLSPEMVAHRNPEVILLLKGHGQAEIADAGAALALLRDRASWRSVAAVRHSRVAVLDDDPVTLPGPRMVEGLEAFARALHPELFGRNSRQYVPYSR